MVGFPNLCKRLYTGGYLTVGLIKHCRTSCDLIYQITCAPLEYPLMSHFFTVHLPVNSADKLVQFIEEIIANCLFFQNTEIQNELPMMLMVNDD